MTQLPSVAEAVESYERAGGKLTKESLFGTDPLKNRDDLLSQRIKSFNQKHGNLESIFESVLRGNGLELKMRFCIFMQ